MTCRELVGRNPPEHVHEWNDGGSGAPDLSAAVVRRTDVGTEGRVGELQ
jgi:hypothetical protein